MILIDTHVLPWVLFEDDKLSEAAKKSMINNKCCVSIASFWEIAIKLSLGKLQLPKSLAKIRQACEDMEIEIVNVTLEDCECVQTLPFIHRDPFDRMILSHALTESMPLITHDSNIRKYDMIETIW